MTTELICDVPMSRLVIKISFLSLKFFSDLCLSLTNAPKVVRFLIYVIRITPNVNCGTKFNWNVNFGSAESAPCKKITFAEVNDLCRNLFVPKLMKFFEICTEVLVPKFDYPDNKRQLLGNGNFLPDENGNFLKR